MGGKVKLKKLYKLWKKRNLLSELFEDAGNEVAAVEQMFIAASDALLRGEKPVLDLVKEDDEINEAKLRIRKKVVEHIIVDPHKDILAYLTLIDISRDLERMGDYSKNILNLSSWYGQALMDEQLSNPLKQLKDTVLQMFKWTSTALQMGDEAEANKVIDSHLKIVAPGTDSLLQRFVGTEYEDAQKAVVSVLYARYLKRISAHLMNIACTSTSTPYHMMKKKKKD